MADGTAVKRDGIKEQSPASDGTTFSAARMQVSHVAAAPAPPCIVVIFGALGDLAHRKLIPALFNLKSQGLLSDEFAVVGVARREKTDDEYRADMLAAMNDHAEQKPSSAEWQEFAKQLHYVQGDFTQADTFSRLKEKLKQIERECHTQGNVLFYLSVPPDSFASIVQGLGAAGMATEAPPDEDGKAPENCWRRVIVEKPFGRDLQSARELDKKLSAVLREDQVYRIDHYLGKETVQNLLVFRFGNGIFEPVWNRRYVDHVQITVAESLGVEGRGNFYESAGALRDMLETHMFQLMALVAMEPPTSMVGESVRNEKTKVFEAVRPFAGPEDVARHTVRGQYGAGEAGGKQVPAYRDEEGVAKDSATETYAAMRLYIENWRWAGVPFYLRTGKRLAGRATSILVAFKEAPLMLYGATPMDRIGRNRLLINIQPCESMMLQIRVKTPGPEMKTQAVNLDFDYEDLGGQNATGYETLLYDCMTGDATLFHRIDMVEAAWKIVTPVLDAWAAEKPKDFPNYASGTWGPEAADRLIREQGHHWWRPEC